VPKATPATKPARQADAAPAIPDEIAQVNDHLKRAQNGDQSTVPALKRMLRDSALVERYGGSIAWQAEQALIRKTADDNFLFAEALTRKLELLRGELAGPNPTPLERLLVERVVACWLQVNDADIRLTQNEPKLTLAQGEYHHRNRDRAHRRYLAALKALALVRKLAIPVLQVNMTTGPQQNIVQGTADLDKGRAQ
jgi:hypothetical protein